MRWPQDDTAVTEVITEGIPLNSFPMSATTTQVPQPPKTRKNRLKNIRLSFAPSSNNHNVSHKIMATINRISEFFERKYFCF